MKILYVLDHFYPHIGGAETLFYNLVTEVAKKHSVTVVTSNSGGTTGIRKVNGFVVHYRKWPLFFGHPIPLYSSVKKLIAEADIIHTATYTSGFFSFMYAKINNKKIVLTVYENLFTNWFMIENYFKASLFMLFEFITVHLPFNYYIAISKATKSDLEKVSIRRKKIRVIYPFLQGINIENKKYRKSNYFLFYGRPGKTKGICTLLKAIALLKKELKNKKLYLKLVLANDPEEERRRIIELINDYQIKNIAQVDDSLPRAKLQGTILRSRFVVVPSVTEGFGYTTYESIQLGRPVVVSDSGSLPEIVGGKHLIFKKNNEFDLKDKLLLAINNRFRKKETFVLNPKTESNKLLNIYSEML